MKRFFSLFLCMVLICAFTTACNSKTESVATFYAMDTTMNLTAYGKGAKNAVADSQAEVNRLEHLLSRTINGSDISRLNQAKNTPITVDGETAAVLSRAVDFSKATDGLFDPPTAPVVTAWGFTTDQYQVPRQEELDALLNRVDADFIELDGLNAQLHNDAQIDLGGIAKGYASDRVAAILHENSVDSAMVSLGGNVYVLGNKPDGSAWRVAVQDPKKPSSFAGVLSLSDAFAVTSGGYQRYFEHSGKIYHHIIDPKTGYPAQNGLISVTVVKSAGDEHAGTMCDAFSTALYVMGEEQALDFWRSEAFDFELILITDDARVLITDGIADNFEQETGSGYVYETIRRSAS